MVFTAFLYTLLDSSAESLRYRVRMQGAEQAARGERARRERRALPPIYFLQERGLQLLRELLQHRENVAQGRDYAVYDQRWNRAHGQRVGRHRRATSGLRRNELDAYFREHLDAARLAEWTEALESLETYDRTEAA